jgi:hypothetical protein
VPQRQIAVEGARATTHHERAAAHRDDLFEQAGREGSTYPRPEHREALPGVLQLQQGVWAVLPPILGQDTCRRTFDESVHDVTEEGDDAGPRDITWSDRSRRFDESLSSRIMLGQRNVEMPLLV